MEFGDFLNNMGRQTGVNIALPNSEEIMKRHLAEPTPPPVRAEQPPAAPSAPPIKEEQELREDTVERIYEATSAILKTLRQAFPNKNERRMAFESIQNALDMAMNDGSSPARSVRPALPPQTPAPARPSRPPRGQMIEDGEYIVPRQNYDLDGVDMPLSASQMNEMTGDPNYSRAIDIKPGQGLIGVSQTDIEDLKALAGI